MRSAALAPTFGGKLNQRNGRGRRQAATDLHSHLFPAAAARHGGWDHQVGVYESPLARLEVYGSRNGVGPVEYYMVVGGKRIQDMDAPGSMTTKNGYRLPAAAAKCVAAKRMPKPEYRTTPGLQGAPASCDGQGVIVVVARAGDQRLALLYGDAFGRWQFCSAAAF
jgi:hypothetical protein